MYATFLFLVLATTTCVDAFTYYDPNLRLSWNTCASMPVTSTCLQARANTETPQLSAAQKHRRQELLRRNGPFFKLNRFQGSVEFGSSAKLVTKLDSSANPTGIAEWLSDGKGLALSIWDENLIEDLGNSQYRLQTMDLQFVTIKLSPSVDVKMWTEPDPQNAENMPVFSLQSVGFDPNIQLLPGVGVSSSSLGIQIEVVGELRPTADGKGVTGTISFSTKGNLPPPLRLLPDAPLKIASDAINDAIVAMAISSFQKGAIKNFRDFQKTVDTK